MPNDVVSRFRTKHRVSPPLRHQVVLLRGSERVRDPRERVHLDLALVHEHLDEGGNDPRIELASPNGARARRPLPPRS